jgi:hypothetical protein
MPDPVCDRGQDVEQQTRIAEVAAAKQLAEQLLGCGDGALEVAAEESRVGKGPKPNGDRDGIVDRTGDLERSIDRRPGRGGTGTNLHPSQRGPRPAFGDARLGGDRASITASNAAVACPASPSAAATPAASTSSISAKGVAPSR